MMSKFVLQLIAYIGLGICCFIQVKECISDYRRHKKTISTNTKFTEHQFPPAIIICPSQAFKPEQVRKQYNMSHFGLKNKDYSMWPNSHDKVQKAWQGITYKVHELIQSLYLVTTDKTIVIDNSTALQSVVDNVVYMPEISAQPVDTFIFGRCYQITVHKKITFRDFIKIGVINDKEAHGSPKAYIIPKGQELSLPFHVFTENPYQANLQKGTEIALSINALEYNYYPGGDGGCDPDTSLEQFQDCFKEKTREFMLDAKRAMGKFCNCSSTWGNCTVPNANMINLKNDKYCIDAESAACATCLMREAGYVYLNYSFKECPRSCVYLNYAVKANSFVTQDEAENISWLFINMPYSFVQVRKEILILDTNAIIGTVGGSMGLFIGFSFLQCFDIAWDSSFHLVSIFKKKI